MIINIASIILLLALAINLLLSILIFIKNPKNKINIIFSLIIFCFAIWNFTSLMADWMKFILSDPGQLLFWAKATLVGPIIMPVLFLLFSLNFPDQQKKLLGWQTLLIFIPTAILLGFVPSHQNIENVILGADGYYFTETGNLYSWFLAYAAAYFILILYFLKKHYEIATGIKRTQILYIITALIIVASIGLTCNVILPIFNYTVLIVYGPLSSIIFSLIIAYAISRYRLMDIHLLIKKSIFFSFSILFLVVIFTFLAVQMQKFLTEYLNVQQEVSIGLIIFILFLFIPNITAALKRKFNNIYSKDFIDFSKKIEDIEKSPYSQQQLFALANDVSASLKKIVNTEQVFFYFINHRTSQFEPAYPENSSRNFQNEKIIKFLKENKDFIVKEELDLKRGGDNEKVKERKELKKEINKINSDVIIPLFSGTELVGIISMSNKVNKESFTTEDIEFVKQIMDNIGDLLANIILFKEAVERVQIDHYK